MVTNFAQSQQFDSFPGPMPPHQHMSMPNQNSMRQTSRHGAHPSHSFPSPFSSGTSLSTSTGGSVQESQMTLWTIQRPFEGAVPQQSHLSQQDLQDEIAKFRGRKLSVKEVLNAKKVESASRAVNQLVAEQNQKLWEHSPCLQWTIVSVEVVRETVKEASFLLAQPPVKRVRRVEVILKTEPRPSSEFSQSQFDMYDSRQMSPSSMDREFQHVQGINSLPTHRQHGSPMDHIRNAPRQSGPPIDQHRNPHHQHGPHMDQQRNAHHQPGQHMDQHRNSHHQPLRDLSSRPHPNPQVQTLFDDGDDFGPVGPPPPPPHMPGPPMGRPMVGPMGGPTGGPTGGPMGGPMGGNMAGPMGGPMGGSMGGPMGGIPPPPTHRAPPPPMAPPPPFPQSSNMHPPFPGQAKMKQDGNMKQGGKQQQQFQVPGAFPQPFGMQDMSKLKKDKQEKHENVPSIQIFNNPTTKKSKSKSKSRSHNHGRDSEDESSSDSTQYSSLSVENDYGLVHRSRSRGRKSVKGRSRSRSQSLVRFKGGPRDRSQSYSRSRSQSRSRNHDHRDRVQKSYRDKRSYHGRDHSDIEQSPIDKHRKSHSHPSPRSSETIIPAQPIVNINFKDDRGRERERQRDVTHSRRHNPSHSKSPNGHPIYTYNINKKHENPYMGQPMLRHDSLGGSSTDDSYIENNSSILSSTGSGSSVFDQPHAQHHPRRRHSRGPPYPPSEYDRRSPRSQAYWQPPIHNNYPHQKLHRVPQPPYDDYIKRPSPSRRRAQHENHNFNNPFDVRYTHPGYTAPSPQRYISDREAEHDFRMHDLADQMQNINIDAGRRRHGQGVPVRMGGGFARQRDPQTEEWDAWDERDDGRRARGSVYYDSRGMSAYRRG